jgi:hypothetical protein
LSEGNDVLALESLQQAAGLFQHAGNIAPERAAAGIELAHLLAKLERFQECRTELGIYLAQARALGDFALAARGDKLFRVLESVRDHALF